MPIYILQEVVCVQLGVRSPAPRSNHELQLNSDLLNAEAKLFLVLSKYSVHVLNLGNYIIVNLSKLHITVEIGDVWISAHVPIRTELVEAYGS